MEGGEGGEKGSGGRRGVGRGARFVFLLWNWRIRNRKERNDETKNIVAKKKKKTNGWRRMRAFE